MARFAHIARTNMRGIFTDRNGAVMAACTASCHLGVINRHHHPVGVRRMARLANTGACNVRRVLVNRIDTVVALSAIVNNPLVIEARRRPRHRGVTRAALRGGRDVRRRLGHRIRAVMALNTVGRVHLRVIELRGFPGRRCVAHVALFGRRNMAGGLAGGFQPVVTCTARAQYFGVVYSRRRIELCGGMAGGTIVGC